MSTESTEVVFAALALANVPARSWNVQSFTDHQKGTVPLSVTDYKHTIDHYGVVALDFTVSGMGNTVEVAGKFKKGSVNEVDVAGAAQAPPTFHGPVEAGTGSFNAGGVKTQIWLRYEAGAHLKEYRFETDIHFPHPLPIVG